MPWLPERLTDEPGVLWRSSLTSPGLGGIAATREYVIVSDRELNDTTDVFRCLDAESGTELWTVRYLALGGFDYGNSSRATPLIHDGRVYLFGADGDLTCAGLSDGEVAWRMNVRDEFDVTDPLPWGFCGSPLIVGERLILNPGGDEGSVVALDPASGDIVWASEGRPPSYGSLIEAEVGGTRQIIGHDAVSLGGWDPESGRRLWTLVPAYPKDFNVPTPVVTGGRVIVSTENNGTRLHGFGDDGRIEEPPAMRFDALAPDTHTPVVIGNRLIGSDGVLYCLDLDDDFRTIWRGRDEVYSRHVCLIASNERLLAWTETGELLLIDPTADEYRLLSRQTVFAGEGGLMAHPAIVGRTIYLRGTNEIVAVSLEE